MDIRDKIVNEIREVLVVGMSASDLKHASNGMRSMASCLESCDREELAGRVLEIAETVAIRGPGDISAVAKAVQNANLVIEHLDIVEEEPFDRSGIIEEMNE